VLFCYRQSPAFLASLSGRVSADDPPPTEPGDAYLELDMSGRLFELRVAPSRNDELPPSPGGFDWAGLAAAAGLQPERVTAVRPRWGPASAYDTRAAWEGVIENERVSVEAAARHGKPTYFRVAPMWMTRPARQDVLAPRAWAFQAQFNAVLILGGLAFLAILAGRNLRLGRGDRRSAWRLAAFVFAALALGSILSRHWTGAPGLPGPRSTEPTQLLPGLGAVGPAQQVVAAVGPALFLALAVWLAYVGFEPSVRRRWPYLLVASTRLLGGRWRDPLVGQSLLSGVFAALAACGLMFAGNRIIRLLGGGVLVPALAPGTLDGVVPFVGYVATYAAVYVLVAVIYMAVLLLARLVFRSDVAAWLGLAAVFFAGFLGWARVFLGPYPAMAAISALALTAGSVVVFWRNGLLALGVWWIVCVLIRDAPWTFALTRWYSWPTWIAAGLIVGLAFWGFRNVLGRQSAFPSDS
jgi:hypothetical protein